MWANNDDLIISPDEVGDDTCMMVLASPPPRAPPPIDPDDVNARTLFNGYLSIFSEGEGRYPPEVRCY